jgi:hypothetical protein
VDKSHGVSLSDMMVYEKARYPSLFK